MSSKRNHKIRSRKTYRQRMSAARNLLTGSLPFAVRQQMMQGIPRRAK